VGTPVPFDIDDLLEKTSRTFALAIPLLPEPTRRSVSLAYLLFRIADTLEDATEWPRAERVAALAQLASACSETFDVDRATRVRERWIVMRGGEHGSVALRTLAELRDYCYLVAGIVGELLTELFVRDTPKLERQRADLDANALLFGEGLQLVNILKDERADAGDGRSYLPEGVARREVIDLARKDLDGAQHYIDALVRGGAPDGYVAFTSLCVNLAVASLDKLEALGPGAKLSREDVFGILSRVNAKSCFRK